MADAPPVIDADAPDLAARLNQFRGELNTRMGVEVVSASREEIVATMPVEGNRQPYGLLHGGASGVLAETLGSLHASILAPAGTNPVGIELNCSHHRSATSGLVTGVCRPLNAGRTLATFQIAIADESGRPVCTARLTCFFRAAL